MEYKAYALMAILLAAVATVGISNAYALTVETDNTSYSTGDTITVSGDVEVTPTGEPLVIQVFNPNGAAYRFDQVDVAADGSYNYTLAVGGPLGVSGEYRIVTTYAGEQEETTFDFQGVEGPRTATLTVGDSTFEIEYDITGGTLVNNELTGEEDMATVTAMINASSDGEVTFWFPREVFDSVENGEDVPFIVFVDEIEEFPDEEAEDGVRAVTIPFSAGSEQIDIVGTFLAPEFGTIAAVVLAVAIVGIIVATTKYSKFSFLPKM